MNVWDSGYNSVGMGEYEAPGIHPGTPTDSPNFSNWEIMIDFINNFLTICPTRLFSVLLDHNTIYIVPKRELSACVSF